MPTSDGRFRGISVPDLPWLKDKAEAKPARSTAVGCPCDGDCIMVISSEPDEMMLCPKYEASPLIR